MQEISSAARERVILALPDWGTDEPERLLAAYLSHVTSDAPLKLSLGMPNSQPTSSFEQRVTAVLEARGLDPEADDFPDIELFELPECLDELERTIKEASAYWDLACGNPTYRALVHTLGCPLIARIEDLAQAPLPTAPKPVPPGPLTLAGRPDALRIFVFNWHEPYLALLARTGHHFEAGDWMSRADGTSGWDERKRPVPANVTLLKDPEIARARLASDHYDLILCQTPMDVLFIGESRRPMIYLAHNAWHADYRRLEAQGEKERRFIQAALAKRGGLFVGISAMKLDSWETPGRVILPGLDVRDYPLGTHEAAHALTVGNLLKERPLFDFDFLEQLTTGHPLKVLGFNPQVPGAHAANSWTELLDAYAEARVYAHATVWPVEDGYNLALLEAMACGTPILARTSPNLPVEDGQEGYVAPVPDALRSRLDHLLANPDAARTMGRAARERVRQDFDLWPFLCRWDSAFLDAIDAFEAQQASAAPAAPVPATQRPSAEGRPRVLIATISNVISTCAYYEKAFRQECEVLTVGPSIDRGELGQWKQVTDQHALKAAGSGDQKIDLIARLTKDSDLPWPKGQPDVRDILMALPSGWVPDLFVWIDNGPEFLPVGLEHLPCPSACLMGDTHTRIDWRLEYARLFDHVFVMFNRQHIPLFEQAGCRNVAWLPAACDPDVHLWTPAEKAYDIGFVGQTLRQWHPDRVRLLERLQAAGFDVFVDTKMLQEMSLVFNRSRIVFNRSLKQDLNMRVFETLATGSLLLTDRLPPEAGLEHLFVDHKHLVLYDEDNLEELAAYYLSHPEERERIARQGREEALARHTYRHRVRQVLEAVGLQKVDASGLPDYYQNQRPEVVARVAAPGARILDVGCGAGAMGAVLKAQGAQEVVGLELNPQAAAIARRRLDAVLELDLNATPALPYPEAYFDCITMADVLEHLVDPAKTLRWLRRYLKDGGRIVCSIPNVRHQSVLLSLLVAGRWQYQDEGILDRTHLRFFTLPEIDQLLADTGFERRITTATVGELRPDMVPLIEAAAQLGGDVERLKQEASILQFIFEAAPTDTHSADAPEAGPHVSIVMPLYNKVEYTQQCLEALVANTGDEVSFELILVDNASSDGTGAFLDSLEGDVTILRNAENLGFAKACNQGAAKARGRHVVFLNNDTIPQPGWLKALVDDAEADPRIGVVGCKLLYPGTDRLQHAGMAWIDGLPDHPHRHAAADLPEANQARDLDMVTGACMLVRRSLFQELGGFDEGYRNGCEDVDLCLQAVTAGFRVRYAPASVLYHYEGTSEGRFVHVQANLERFMGRWRACFDATGHFTPPTSREATPAGH